MYQMQTHCGFRVLLRSSQAESGSTQLEISTAEQTFSGHYLERSMPIGGVGLSSEQS